MGCMASVNLFFLEIFGGPLAVSMAAKEPLHKLGFIYRGSILLPDKPTSLRERELRCQKIKGPGRYIRPGPSRWVFAFSFER